MSMILRLSRVAKFALVLRPIVHGFLVRSLKNRLLTSNRRHLGLLLLFFCQFLPFVFFLQDLVSIFRTASLADGQILAEGIFFDHEALLQSFLHDPLAEPRLFGQFRFATLLRCDLVLGGLRVLLRSL